jgi:hypothetical protein
MAAAAAVLTIPSPPLSAQMPDLVREAVVPLRDAVYGHSADEEGIRSLHEAALARIRHNTRNPEESSYAAALVHYYLGRYYQALKTTEEMGSYAADLRSGRYLALRKYYTERDAAMDAYRAARTEAEKYLAAAAAAGTGSRTGAEAYRLYGEILGQMLFLGGAADVLEIGGKAKKNVERALELDPGLVKARIQEASRLAYSPDRWGGDPAAARTLYRDILRQGGTDREDLFNIYGGFAMAAFMEGSDAESAAWFEEALLVYPGSVFAAGMRNYLLMETHK